MVEFRKDLVRKLEHVEAFPLVALQAVRELRSDLDTIEAEAIVRARELGAALEDIADALEITRQGVSYKLKSLSGNGQEKDRDVEADDVPEVEPEARAKSSQA